MTGGQNFSKRSSKKNNNGHSGKLPPSSGGRFGITLLLLIGSIFIVFMMLNKETNVYPSVSYTDFLSAVEQGQVSDVQITDQKIILGTMRSVNGSPVQQSRFQTVIPYTDTDLIAFLETKGVHISGKLSKPSLLTDVFSLLPLVLTVVLIFLM